jgi:hypothetical protein
MDCLCCYGKLPKTNKVRLCSKCKSDKTLLMSATNIKKIYGLTDEDLNSVDNNFHFFEFKYKCVSGRRFIIKEIEDYVVKQIENGNKKLEKKLKVIQTKKEKKEKKDLKTLEINTFLSQNIRNKTHSDILEIIDEYIESNNISLDKISIKISEKDKQITKNIEHKQLFFNNLKKIIINKLSNNKYFIHELKLEEYIKFINSIEYSNFINTISIWIRKYESKYHQCISSVNEIYKSGLLEIVYTDLKYDILKISSKYFRKNQLIEALKNQNLTLRQDSKICDWYINGGIENVNDKSEIHIESINDIVDIMIEMNFYHTCTKYAYVNKDQLRRFSEYVYDSDFDEYGHDNYGHYEHIKPISEINFIAKKIVISDIIKSKSEHILNNAPKNVIDLYILVSNELKQKIMNKTK